MIKRLMLVLLTLLPLLFFSSSASAAGEQGGTGMMETVSNTFKAAAEKWENRIERAAYWIFWSLALVSLVFTVGLKLLEKADVGDIIAEVTRFFIFLGVFWWLLMNGPTYATVLVSSFMQLGGEASGLSSTMHPGEIYDIGRKLFFSMKGSFSFTDIVPSLLMGLLGIGVFVIMVLISANILLTLCKAWVLSYAGIILLGFGGARWTWDIAINYYKTVLSLAVSLMVMVLLVGTGFDLLNKFVSDAKDGLEIVEALVILGFAIVLFLLVSKMPDYVSGIIMGSSVGSGGGTSVGGMIAVGMGAASVLSLVSKYTGVTAGGKALGSLAGVAGKSALSAVKNSAGKIFGGSGSNKPASSYSEKMGGS